MSHSFFHFTFHSFKFILPQDNLSLEKTVLIGDIPIAFASEFNSLLSKVVSWKEVSKSSVIP